MIFMRTEWQTAQLAEEPLKAYTTRKPSFVPKSKRDWPTSYPALEKAPRWMIIYILVFYHEISIEVQF
jgi:hypothetical protein